MTPSVTEVPPEFRELPQVALDAIHAACAGDWRRVETLGRGEWLIHNQPQTRRITLPDARPKQRTTAWGRGVAARPVAREASVSELMDDMDPMQVARHMASEFAGGIHSSIDIELAEYILNASSHLVSAGLAAARTPNRVEIDPATVEKGPRLRFYRGDVVAIIAFSNPTQPYLIDAKTEASLRSA